MDRSERLMHLQARALVEVRMILSNSGGLNAEEITRRDWVVGWIDDKSIFDADATHLAHALQFEGRENFFVARVCDLLNMRESVPVFRFAATKDDIEEFQGAAWYEINLDDCLLFDQPLTCAVLRPGTVDKTTYVGNAVFIEMAGCDSD
ncbi:hypothetical protein AAHK20_26435 [Trinickia sp. YCB016]